MKKKLLVLLAGIVILFSLCFYFFPEELSSLASEAIRTDWETLENETEDRHVPGKENETADQTVDSDGGDTAAGDGEGDSAGLFSESELPEHLKYYYGTLSEDDQLLYRSVYVIARDHLDYTQINTTDSEKLADVMEYVLLDNPELFYVESIKTRTTTTGSTSTMTITVEESMTADEQSQAKQQIAEFAQSALAQITSGMSEYDKALCIYEYVVSNLEYVDGAPYNQSLYSAALGQTVCRGYACAFKFLCDQAGISCIMVTGTMQGENHAWNLVCLDGQWCYVDCTAGDDLVGKSIEVDYSWFGMDYSTISRSHEVSLAFILPSADSLANNYYYRNGLYFESYSVDYLTGLLSAGADFSFQCATESVYNQYYSGLSESQEIAQAIGTGNQVQYMGNGTTYTIYIQFLSD